VLQHIHDLDLVINTRRIDVLLLTETHLTTRQNFYLSNFTIYRTDHPDNTAKGGTAIAIRSCLKHHPLPPTAQNYIQSTSISISTASSPLTLASVYCPPRFSIHPNTFTQFFQSLGPRFIAGGDYNAKHQRWGSRLNTPKGRSLNSCITLNNYSFFSPPCFTYWPTSLTKQPDLLDFFVVNNVNEFHNIDSVDEISSDHSCIVLTLSTSPLCKLPPPSLTRGVMDWDNFRGVINSSINLRIPLRTADEIETAVENLNCAIHQAASSSCLSNLRNDNRRHTYPTYIRTLIREKRRARKVWQTYRRPSDKVTFNRMNNELKKVIKDFKERAKEDYIATLNTVDLSLWNRTKTLLKYHTVSPPLRRIDGSWVMTDLEKANEFAIHLSHVFKPHPNISNPQHQTFIEESLSTALPLSLPPRPFKPSEVQNAIRQLPKKKSPGYDLISAEVLQNLPRKGLMLLTYIFNAILRTSNFPIQWKFAQIKMIQKPGKPPHAASSYRPISLLPVCSKLFEKLLMKRIIPIIQDYNILPDHQFGFRESHSTIHQLHRVIDFLAVGLERKLYSAGVFIDIAQAFDRVWLEGLLYKLRFLPYSYYLILQSFLQDRYFSVIQGSSQSLCFPILAGVPQGSVLAPLLFNIYTSDIPTSPTTLLASYADDTVILSSSPSSTEVSHNLQSHMTRLESWFTKWRIQISTTKSTHTTFTLRRETCPRVFLYGQPLPQTDNVRYLGLYIDRRLTWNKHVTVKRKTLDERLKRLYSLLSKRSKLPLRLKLLVYKAFLRPIWLYACQIYGAAKPSVIAKIQRFQSKFLRLITFAPSYVSNETLHNDLQVAYVNETFHKIYTKFRQKLTHHTNRLIRDLSSLHLPSNPPRRLRRLWSRDIIQ
jgi:hypothetical protein